VHFTLSNFINFKKKGGKNNMMQRKHYKAIAKIFKKDLRHKEDLINNLGEFFKKDNPNFDLKRFKKASGVITLEEIIGSDEDTFADDKNIY